MLDKIFCNFSFFFTQFFWLMGWVWELFWGFLRFQLLFSGFFPAFGLSLGAVLEISAVSATFFSDFFQLLGLVWELFWRFLRFQLLFSRIFFGFWVEFGSCFKSFMDYSSTRACLLGYQPMAIVHYANLVLLNKYTFLTEGRYARPGHRWRTRTLLQAHSETV